MTNLVDQLNSKRRFMREQALCTLAKKGGFPEEGKLFNMHLHTFFSYNGEDWSPSRIAYEMKMRGMYAAAICDFDVLQGLDEFLAASDILGLRAAVAMESRVFFKEYAKEEINSPGEPGVFYFMGMGFTEIPTPGSPSARQLQKLLENSHTRNRELINRINRKMTAFELDYDKDVLPLTPNGNATERHIVAAFQAKAIRACGSVEKAAQMWAKLFHDDTAKVAEIAPNINKMREYLRSKLMKKGGMGYKKPGPDTFPPLDSIINFIRRCRAIPMSAYLDGDSQGEANPQEQLELLLWKGVEAVNIIPDRNWNFKDADVKKRKMDHLAEYIRAADALDLPINIGTECNKPGQRIVDDLLGPELSPYYPTFLRGTQVMVGHTLLRRYADLGLVDVECRSIFRSRKERNDFFAMVGALPPPSANVRKTLLSIGHEKAFDKICAAVSKKHW